MKTVKVTPDNIISAIDVNFDDFRDLQKAVGGHFEIVSTKTLYETFKMPMIMLVDEDGIMKQKEVNRLGSYCIHCSCKYNDRCHNQKTKPVW